MSVLDSLLRMTPAPIIEFSALAKAAFVKISPIGMRSPAHARAEGVTRTARSKTAPEALPKPRSG